MSNWNQLIEGIISGVLTGGASAATTVLTLFRDLRKRVSTLEERMGSNGESKTGLHLSVSLLEDNVRRIKREMDGWEDEPPVWAHRLLGRRAATSSYNLEQFSELEQRIDNKVRLIQGKLDELDGDIERAKREHLDLISRKEYEIDSRERAEEIAAIQKNLASANGFLRGVMAALGYLEPDLDPKKDPKRDVKR